MLGVIALGGGFDGAISVGYWKYFKEKEIIPDYAQLVSVNVLNGLSFISRNSTEELEDWWLNTIAQKGPSFIFRRGNKIDFFYRLLFGDHLFNSGGLEFLIKNGGDVKTFLQSPIYTEIATCNESKGYELNFFNKQNINPLFFSDMILAATALTPAFKPRLIEGQWHSDALTFDIERAIDYGCNKIIIMRNDHDKKINRPKHWFTRLTRSEGFLVNELTEAKIQLARLNNVNCEIVELKINKSLPNINTEHFQSPDDIKRAIDYGYEAAVKILK